MADQTRRIEYLPVRDLQPNKRNPKDHDLPLLQDSLGRFGIIDIITRDDRTGLLVSGHGRAEALALAEEKGETPPEGVTVGKGGVWLTPVIVGWASKDDAEAEAALVALNQIGVRGGWNEGTLLDILENLNRLDGLTGVGYSEADIDDLRAYLDAKDLTGDGLDPNDYDPLPSTRVPIRDGQAEVIVVYELTNREDLYNTLHGLDWVVDVRDRSKT